MPFPFLALAAGLGVAQMGLSIYGASQQNEAIEDQLQANRKVAEEEQQQQARIYGLQAARSRRNAQRVMGLITVSAAERGVGTGGSVEALELTAAVDEGMNREALGIERYGAERRTLGGLRLTQLGLRSRYEDPFIAGITGALQGVSTGLSIGQGIRGLRGG